MRMSYTTVSLRGHDRTLGLVVSWAEALALNYAPERLRYKYASLFALEAQLRRFVVDAREEMLVRIKLAWWREQLARDGLDEIARDPLLALMRQEWAGETEMLAEVVAGYEHLLVNRPTTAEHLDAFVGPVSAPFAQVARTTGQDLYLGAVRNAALVWAIGWLNEEQWLKATDRFVQAAIHDATRSMVALPRTLRPLSVLFALSRRSVQENGAPLVPGRIGVATALRAGLLGR